MEDKAELEKRINEAADFVAKGQGSTREEALKQLAISPQCGFASHSEGNPVNFDDVRTDAAIGWGNGRVR